MKDIANKGDTLVNALEVLTGQRDSDYGDPLENFERIAGMASFLSERPITPDMAICVMIGVKLSRESYKHKSDNLIDLVSYIDFLNLLREKKEKD